MFREDSKRFYRELGKKTIQIEKPPDIGEVKKFWQNILEQEVKHNEDAQWIKDQEEELQQINQMEWKDLTVEELRVNMTRAANWKSPGADRLPQLQDQTVQEPPQTHGRSILRKHHGPKANSRLASRRSHQPTT